MATFTYTVVDRNGQQVTETKTADSKADLIDFLISRNYTIISISEKFGADFSNLLNIEIGGFATNEKVIIAKQLATMITAGIPIIQAIDILRQQAEKQSLKDLLDDVYKKIEAGSPLSKAFDQKLTIFSSVQLSLIAAGEKSGNLNEMLIKVAEDMEKSKQLQGKITGALIYPAIVFVVLIVVITVMIAFMVPQVEELYQSLGKDDLPFVTRILVWLGNSLANPVFLVFLAVAIIGAIFSYRAYVSKPEGKFVTDKLKLKVPVFGELITKIQIAEFCRLMSMLLGSGLPIIQAVEIVSQALSNDVFSRTVLASKDEVTKGSSFSLGIAKHNYEDGFPVILIKMISVGEEAGKLDKVLNDMYKFYDDEVEQMTSNLTKLLEPMILVIVGGFVAFLAIAIYLPIYGIGDI